MHQQAYPLPKVYGLLEPGPVVLLSTAHRDQQNIMTLSWHCMLEFAPPLVGCVVSRDNHSFELLSASRECVINIPTVELAQTVVNCGNCSGRTVDKFQAFGLTARPASRVCAPLIGQCAASLECRLLDDALVERYDFFILEVVHAWLDPAAEPLRTLHHRGHGRFMLAGRELLLPSDKA